MALIISEQRLIETGWKQPIHEGQVGIIFDNHIICLDYEHDCMGDKSNRYFDFTTATSAEQQEYKNALEQERKDRG